MNQSEKRLILKQVIQILNNNLEILVNSALEAKEFSTNEESKAENKYDTRGLEASYLASGQAQRAQKLKEQIYILEQVTFSDGMECKKVGVGSLVKILVNDQDERLLFVLPSGGV